MRVAKRLFLFVVTAVMLSACFALTEPEEASGPVEAPTLAVAEATEEPTTAPALEEVATTVPAEESAAPEEPTAIPVEEAPTAAPVEEEPTAVPEEEPTALPEEETAVIAPPAGLAIFEIAPDQSEARFLIDEVLRGTPVTVVGVTNAVAGQIAFDVENPATAQVGQILINARTIVTDSDFRNRAISNRILFTNNYEFITFTPTQLVGLPDATTPGEAHSFQIVGDLTITDQTREVTFETNVTPTGNSLEGLATTTILYADFGLEIPFSQSVDSVEDSVILELEFVAPATGDVAAGG